MWAAKSPAKYLSQIKRTVGSSRELFHTASPFGTAALCRVTHSGLSQSLGGFTWRFRSFASATLSFCVPHRRCLGLQQDGVSHECRALAPSWGGGPYSRTQDIREAATFIWRVSSIHVLINPYPAFVLVFAIQGQHSSGVLISIFDQNRSMNLSLNNMRGPFPMVSNYYNDLGEK